MNVTSLLALALAGAISAGTTTPPPVAAATRQEAQHCFWVRSVDSFRSVDSKTVYVRASMRDVYELKLFAPCLDVDWAHHIGLRARGSSNVCEGRSTWLEVYVRAPRKRQTCQVSSVRYLTPAEVAALPAAARP